MAKNVGMTPIVIAKASTVIAKASTAIDKKNLQLSLKQWD
jgi:hypothetical protein